MRGAAKADPIPWDALVDYVVWLTTHTTWSAADILELPIEEVIDLFKRSQRMFYIVEQERFSAALLAAHGTKDGVKSFQDSVFGTRVAEIAEASKKSTLGIAEFMRDFGA